MARAPLVRVSLWCSSLHPEGRECLAPLPIRKWAAKRWLGEIPKGPLTVYSARLGTSEHTYFPVKWQEFGSPGQDQWTTMGHRRSKWNRLKVKNGDTSISLNYLLAIRLDIVVRGSDHQWSQSQITILSVRGTSWPCRSQGPFRQGRQSIIPVEEKWAHGTLPDSGGIGCFNFFRNFFLATSGKLYKYLNILYIISKIFIYSYGHTFMKYRLVRSREVKHETVQSVLRWETTREYWMLVFALEWLKWSKKVTGNRRNENGLIEWNVDAEIIIFANLKILK